jgi:ribose/xylose/arabinose/galactoside ABC-type transport system permease subunit
MTQLDASGSGTRPRGARLRSVLSPRVLIPLLLVVLLGAAQIASNGAFMQPRNLLNILAQNSITGTLATGQTLVVLSGGIDLSLGSVTALASIVTLLLQDHCPLVARAGGIAVGLGCGAINGLLVVVGRVPPFIATLGMMQAALGMSYIVSGGYPVYENEHMALIAGLDRVGPAPLIILLWLFVVLIAWILLRLTRFGASVYAIGGNERTAIASGIPVGWVKFLVYVLAGLSASIAGIISINRLGYSEPTIGNAFTLDSIAPVVLGGTSLFGGVGGVIPTVGGVLVAGVLNNLMVLLGVNIYAEQIVQGVIILAFVFFFLKFQRR